MRVVITGAAGFIGSELARVVLSDGHAVVGVDDLSGGRRERLPSGIVFHEADVAASASSLVPLFRGSDVVFHLAALTSVAGCQADPVGAERANVTGTETVIEALRRVEVDRLIVAETAAVYEGTELWPTPEAGERPISVYGRTKFRAGQRVEELCREYEIRFTKLRYFNVYGHSQGKLEGGCMGDGKTWWGERGPIIPSFIRAAMHGRHAVIFGDGLAGRDYIHVDDINAFHLAAIDDPRTYDETFNLGTGESVTVAAINALIQDVIPGPTLAPMYVPNDVPEAPHTQADIRKAMGVGWMPAVQLRDGIARCVASYRASNTQGR